MAKQISKCQWDYTKKKKVRHDSSRDGEKRGQGTKCEGEKKARAVGNAPMLGTEDEYPGKRGFKSILALSSHGEVQET